MRRPTPQTQLEWVDPETLRWEDLPASVRDRVREHLGALLRHAVWQGSPGSARRTAGRF